MDHYKYEVKMGVMRQENTMEISKTTEIAQYVCNFEYCFDKFEDL